MKTVEEIKAMRVELAEKGFTSLKTSSGLRILVDRSSLKLLNKKSGSIISLDSPGYPKIYRRVGKKYQAIRIHRIIMEAKKGQVVDHINGNKLDNRRKNLRLTDYFGNARNSSVRKKTTSNTAYKGIYWNKERNLWQAQICINYKRINLGRYEKERDAAMAYNKAAKKYFGQFASLNKLTKETK